MDGAKLIDQPVHYRFIFTFLKKVSPVATTRRHPSLFMKNAFFSHDAWEMHECMRQMETKPKNISFHLFSLLPSTKCLLNSFKKALDFLPFQFPNPHSQNNPNSFALQKKCQKHARIPLFFSPHSFFFTSSSIPSHTKTLSSFSNTCSISSSIPFNTFPLFLYQPMFHPVQYTFPAIPPMLIGQLYTSFQL